MASWQVMASAQTFDFFRSSGGLKSNDFVQSKIIRKKCEKMLKAKVDGNEIDWFTELLPHACEWAKKRKKERASANFGWLSWSSDWQRCLDTNSWFAFGAVFQNCYLINTKPIQCDWFSHHISIKRSLNFDLKIAIWLITRHMEKPH